MNSAVELNGTKSNTERCVNSISEPIEQIEPDRTQSIRLCPIGFGSRTQSNGLRPFEYGEKIRLNKNVMLSQKHEKYELY